MNQKTPAKQATEVSYPEDLDVIYVNHSQFLMTAADLNIDVGVVRPDPTSKKATVHIKTRLTMSPQHAKMFLSKMQDILDGYERDFGEIPIKPKKK